MRTEQKTHRRNEVTAMAAAWLFLIQLAIGAGVVIAIFKGLIDIL